MKFDSILSFLKYCKTISNINSSEYNIYVLNVIKQKPIQLNIKASISQPNSKLSYIITVDITPNNVNIYCPCEQDNCDHISNTVAYLIRKYNLELDLLQMNLLENKNGK